MSKLLQHKDEDVESLSSVDNADQYDDEEHVDENGPLTLEKSDFPPSSNIAVRSEGDMGMNIASRSNEPGRTSDNSESNNRLFFTTKGDHLSVTFVEAVLEENYGFSRMDPYCVMKVGSVELRTQVCQNGSTNPHWGEKLQCEIPPSVCLIFIEIFDRNTFQTDDKIAWTTIPIMHLIESGKDALDSYDLSGKHGQNEEGKLQLITTYTPNVDGHVHEQFFLSNPNNSAAIETQQGDGDPTTSSGQGAVMSVSCSEDGEEPPQQNTESDISLRDEVSLSEEQFNSMGGYLKILCVEARLKHNYGITRMDPYCVIKVGAETLTTPVCRNGSTTPRWNETLECNLPPGVCVISIEIFDSNSLESDDKIAWTTILIKDIRHLSGRNKTDWYSLSGEQGEDEEGDIQLTTCYEDLTVEIDGQNRGQLDNITTFVNVTRRQLTDYHNHVPHDLNIILVGRSGNGKSSVGNTIMGQECFPRGTDGNQRTVCLAKMQKGNFKINVMDTPNVLDERKEIKTEQKVMEIVKTAMDFPDGIHLFLIVCRSDIRLSDEEKTLFELEKKYGQSVYDRSLLVLTHVREFLQNNTLEEALKANKDLWNVCKQVHGRVVAIENDSEQLTGITMEDQQTQLLRTVLEVIRLQKGTLYRNKWYNEVRAQIHEREEKHKGTLKTYDILFDHVVNTFCSKSESDLCQILKTREFVIDNDVLNSNDVCQDENIIRQCKKWCIKDLETFINLILTDKRFEQCNDSSQHDSIENYKRRSLQTARDIKRNRQNLMLIFSNDVERCVRSFLRCKELSDIENIMSEVEELSKLSNIDNIIREVEGKVFLSDVHKAILESLPENFKSEEWKYDVHFLGLQSLQEYLEMKNRAWPNTLLLQILGNLSLTAGTASVFGGVTVGIVAAEIFLIVTGTAAVLAATGGIAGVALLVGGGLAGVVGGIFMKRRASNRLEGNDEE